jgi:hypothetical protein
MPIGMLYEEEKGRGSRIKGFEERKALVVEMEVRKSDLRE